MTLIGRPFSFQGQCRPARHGAILFSTEEYRKEILVFKVGSSHVAALFQGDVISAWAFHALCSDFPFKCADWT